MEILDKITHLMQLFHAEASTFLSQSETAESFRIRWMGKKGYITDVFEEMKTVAKEIRPEAGKQIHALRQKIDAFLAEQQKKESEQWIESTIASRRLDPTLPVSLGSQGALHPVTLMRHRLIEIFQRYGFSVYEGPEIETDFYNFAALNFPEEHPARDMQDTFFLADQPSSMVLRTHTSNAQIHSMLQEKPPLRLISPGKVFRVDSDASHTPTFHQLECLVVDRRISMAHLKGMIDAFVQEVFGSDIRTRFRPSFFPFVEPGAEMDVACTLCRGKGCQTCSHSGWLEIGGCGMIHPNVFEAVNYDSEEYTGFAFGFGIDRMAMLAYGLPDLRQLFEGDVSLHRQFSLYP